MLICRKVGAAAGPWLSASAASADAPRTGCAPDSERLCFEEGRYFVAAVGIGWQGATTAALTSALNLGPHAGAFWFFDASALELVVRLRREPITGRVDLSIAALTNLGYEVRVVDAFTGRVATATNAPGTFRSVEITDLFPAP